MDWTRFLLAISGICALVCVFAAFVVWWGVHKICDDSPLTKGGSCGKNRRDMWKEKR